MLILTRRIGENLRIGDDVSVVIVGVGGNQVRIGIDAPKEIQVHREEIYQRIQREKQQTDQPQKPAAKKLGVGQTIQNTLSYFSTAGSQNTSNKTPTVIVKNKKRFSSPTESI